MTPYESTTFKRKLNEFKICQVGFADLNAHALDSFLVGRYKPKNSIIYFSTNLLWILSKIIKRRKKTNNKKILFAPSELEKERSIGLYNPITKILNEETYQVIVLHQIFYKINLITFLKWCCKIPKIVKQVLKITNSDVYSEKLKSIKWVLCVDSIFHYLWIMQLSDFFKSNHYKSVVVDWDRHKLQSLLVLAAKKEKVKTFTFVHGAIYTPEKFVPLIAENCFVWGENHINFFFNLGERKEKLLKVGNTRFSDRLPNKKDVLRKYGITTSKKIILHPSQNFPDIEDHQIIKNLYHFISQNENYQLAVKFHPSQNNTILFEKIKSLENVIILDQSISASEALSIAEFTIIVSSTFAIDALIADVPVAIYKPTINLRGIAVELVQDADVPLLETKEDFKIFLNNVMNNPLDTYFNRDAQRNFRKNYCEFYGEASAELIAKLV